jgi:hypothetical protein
MKLINKLLVSSILFLFSNCISPSEIGIDFFNTKSLDINYTDTLSVKISTVMFDSIITLSPTRLLVGTHHDEYLGIFRSSPIFQVGSEMYTGLEENSEFAYLALHLKLDGYSYYDTLEGLRFNVYQISKNLELSDDGYLYGTSTFHVFPDPIGSADFLPEPNYIDSLEVKLSNSVGLDLFQLAQSEDSRISSNDEFIDYFKGLAIIPDMTTQSCFLGIDKTSSLRLYYYDNNSIPAKKKYIEFSLASIYYNQIMADRSLTLLKDLTTQEFDVESTATDNMSFIQAGIGLALKVDFPFLEEVKFANKDLVITKAELKLRPTSYSTNSANTVPLSDLDVYFINDLNEMESKLSVSASLINTDVLERDVYYSLDVTDFVNEVMNGTNQEDHSLLVTATESSLNSSIDRIFIGDRYSRYKTELKIYYLDIK